VLVRGFLLAEYLEHWETQNACIQLRKKYFKPVDDKRLQAADTLKSLIRFDRVNLSDDSKMVFLKGLGIIFCCNLLIYFALASKRRVEQHFFSNLLPGGYLFLGHSESRYKVDDNFRLVHFPGTTGYLKPPWDMVRANHD